MKDQITYDVYLNEDESPYNSLICVDTPKPECDPGILKTDTQYKWYVTATDSGRNSIQAVTGVSQPGLPVRHQVFICLLCFPTSKLANRNFLDHFRIITIPFNCDWKFLKRVLPEVILIL